MTQRAEFSVTVKRQIYERAGGICETPSCENSGLEYDHIVECWEGGRATYENCRLLCPKCHKDKSAHSTGLRAKGKRFAIEKGRPKSGKIKSRSFEGKGKSKIPTRRDPWNKEYKAKLKARA